MGQQHTTQASSQGMLGRVLKLREHGMTARAEVIAGLTTFLTMVYVAFVNPQILGVVDTDTSAVFVMTCLITALGSIMMGPFANPPVTLAPTMGLNTFFVFVVVQAIGLSRQVGVGVTFWDTIGLLPLTILHVRYWMIANTPVSLRVGITSGTGLFIDTMGLKNVSVIVASPEVLVSIGNLTSHSVLSRVFGFFVIAVLTSCNTHAVVLVSIMATTLLGWMPSNVYCNDIVPAPPDAMTVMGHVDLVRSFNLGLAGVIFSFMSISLFDPSGTLIDVIDKAGLMDKKDRFLRMKQALYVDSISSVTGSLIGTSSVMAHIESSFGVFVDSHTGLMAVVVGLLFLLVIFLSSLVGMVPGYAAVGAPVYVGMLVISNLARASWQGLTESVPAFITAVVMPFSLSITEGIALSFISYYAIKIDTGRLRDLSPCIIIVALLLVLKIVFIDAHQN